MLSAQKQDMPVDTSLAQSDSRSASGFGKVISSLQGLQQRLEDFSVDDLVKAETKAQTLIRRLTQFQDKLATLAELKNWIVSATEMVARVAEPQFDLVNVDSLAKHPQLHSLVKAGKLIKFLKLVKATKESAQLNAAGVDEIRLPDAPSTVNLLNGIFGLPATENRSPAGSPEIDPTPVDEIAALPAVIEVVDAPPLPLAALEAENSKLSDSFPPSLTLSSDLTDSVPDPIVDQNTASQSFTHEPQSTKANETNDVNPAMPDNSQEPASSTPQPTKAHAHNAGSFDQRLLDDVIKNYGEFKTLADIPATADLPKRAKPEFEDTRIPPASDAIAVIEASQASLESSAEQPALQAPADFTFDIDPAAASAGRLPSVRKDGELDRQLKKIIKDYGEYDLYSHHSPVNLKTAGIAVFAVLGLVFGGIYFFRTPNPPSPPPAARVLSSPTTSTDQTARESKEKTSNGGEKTETAREATNAAKRSQNKNQ